MEPHHPLTSPWHPEADCQTCPRLLASVLAVVEREAQSTEVNLLALAPSPPTRRFTFTK